MKNNDLVTGIKILLIAAVICWYPAPGFGEPVYYEENFNGYPDLANPVDWEDTATFSSFVENDTLFFTLNYGGSRALITDSAVTSSTGLPCAGSI